MIQFWDFETLKFSHFLIPGGKEGMLRKYKVQLMRNENEPLTSIFQQLSKGKICLCIGVVSSENSVLLDMKAASKG